MEVRLVRCKGGELALQGKYPNRKKWNEARIVKRFGAVSRLQIIKRARRYIKKHNLVLAHPEALDDAVEVDEK
jgi:hypothetical protein